MGRRKSIVPKGERYDKKIISIEEKERLMGKYEKRIKFDRKAEISGTCIHLYTDNNSWVRQWDDNWYTISENIRSHGKLIAIQTGEKRKRSIAKYDPVSRTVFFLDSDYYGHVKSLALSLAGEVLEDNHNIFSIHGGLLDVEGKGVTIIGPPKTGKTTLSYGLLKYNGVKLVADDWHFFRFFGREVAAYCSEKNTYIRADVALTWPEYSGIWKIAKFDNKGRAIIDVSYLIGKGNIKKTTAIKNIFLLMRKKGKKPIKKLKPKEAVKYLENVSYCNPHIIQRNAWKNKVRRNAFLKLFENTNVYLLNTIETPAQSLERIRKITGAKKTMKKMKL